MPIKVELEAQISQAIIRFEKEYMGRGPLETRTYLIDDLVLVRLKGVLGFPSEGASTTFYIFPERAGKEESIDVQLIEI
jgi:uncharacterized protein YbcI